MTKAKKIGIFLIAAGILLPSVTLLFITEYHPQSGICLTSNFFSNLGNMVVYTPLISIPYRYLFVLGVISGCVGIGTIALSSVKVPAARSRAKKIGIIMILAGLCLPVVTMPYISEFRPQPDICLSSNFFGNFRSMLLSSPLITVPYRYLFVLGINLACIGAGTIVLSSGKASVKPETLTDVEMKK
ncbi:MAG: hypothetical protein ABFR82_08570 [Nitrospirota bacterium]